MKKIVLMFSLFLPLSAMAQSDTLYVKGGAKVPTTITRVISGKVYYSTSNGEHTMPEGSLEKYYWSKEALAPKKKDNYIIIETTDSPDDAFIKIGKILADKNFPLSVTNKEIGIINTGSKPLNGVVAVQLSANIKSTEEKTNIIITGVYDGADITLYGVSSEQKGSIFYATSSTNNMTKAWAEMDNVAKAYLGGKITYGRR